MKRIIGALLAAFLLLTAFSVPAYAGGGDAMPVEAPSQEQQPIVIDITPRPVEDDTEPPATESTGPASQPFTPPGTGETVDNATESDGKEFFTIMTPDENVFYLIIDRQRETENVYLLDAVTEAELRSLAELPPEVAPPITAPVISEPDPKPQPEPQKSSGGMLLMVVVIAIAGGGAGWYFKIYRPKQQGSGADMDAEADYDEPDPYDEPGADWPDEEPPGEDFE